MMDRGMMIQKRGSPRFSAGFHQGGAHTNGFELLSYRDASRRFVAPRGPDADLIHDWLEQAEQVMGRGSSPDFR